MRVNHFLLLQHCIGILLLCGCNSTESWYYDNPEFQITLRDKNILQIKTITSEHCRKDIYFPPIWVNWDDHIIAVDTKTDIIQWKNFLRDCAIDFTIIKQYDGECLEISWRKSSQIIRWELLFKDGKIKNFVLNCPDDNQFPLRIGISKNKLLPFPWSEERLNKEFEIFYLKSVDFMTDGIKKYYYSFLPILCVNIRNGHSQSIETTIVNYNQSCFFLPLYFEYNQNTLKLDNTFSSHDLIEFLDQNGYTIINNAGSVFDMLYLINSQKTISIVATQQNPQKGSFWVLFVGEKIYSFKYYMPSRFADHIKMGFDIKEMYSLPLDKNVVKKIWGNSPTIFQLSY